MINTRILALGLAGALLLAAPRRPPEHPVDLNLATRTELMQLPRVGARTAERILAFRREHGPFRRAEDLMNVKGIGEKSYGRLQPYIMVDGLAPAREPGQATLESTPGPRRRARRGQP